MSSQDREDVFNDRDEEFMRTLLDVAVKWASERPDAAPTGLAIMGNTMLSVAINGPDLDGDDTEIIETNSKVVNLIAQERPHDALDIILSRIQPNHDDHTNDTEDSSTDQERSLDEGGT